MGDLRRPWLAFGLTVTGCAIGGFCLGALIAAVVVKRLTDELLR